MSDNASEENLFKDYCKAENTDDEESNCDLEARLYAEIYYQSNIESESEINNISKVIQTNCITYESIEQQNMQYRSEDKRPPEMTKELLTCGDTLRTEGSTDSCASIDIQKQHLAEQIKSPIQTNRENLTDQETIDTSLLNYNNSTTYDNTNNEILVQREEILRKESKEKSSKKYKSFKHSKNKHQKISKKEDNTTSVNDTDMDTRYNVLQKKVKQKILLANQHKQSLENSSDSEESIFEVPIPPKPKPVLIELQDSDEEDATNSAIDEDDLFTGRLYDKSTRKNADSRVSLSVSPELEVIEVSTNRNAFPKNKITDKSSKKNASAQHDDNVHNTCIREASEDIVLNCTTVQKGAKSISEIKQLCKSIEMGHGERNILIEETNEERSLQDVSRENSRNNSPQRISSGKKSNVRMVQQSVDTDKTVEMELNVVHDLRYADQDLTDKTLIEVSCDNSNLTVSRKRHREDSGQVAKNNSSAQKRQCTTWQSDPNVAQMPRAGTSGGMMDRRRDKSFWNDYFFKPMSEKLRRFYTDSRGQENFDARELQRNMSKDPRKWAILDEDLMPSPSRHSGLSRYWNGARCSYCQRDGHLRKDCPEPPKPACCYMCGKQGHTERRCLLKVCLTCGRKQSTFRKTCEFCRTLYCTMCKSIGHKVQQCPDLWRRYHQTTIETSCAPPNPGNIMKPTYQLYCCNCAKRGHEMTMCKEYRWSLHFVTPIVVTNYTDGPVYVPERASTIPIESSPKTADVVPPGTKTNRTPQRFNDTSEMNVQTESTSNIDTSPVNTKTNETSFTQDIVYIPEAVQTEAIQSFILALPMKHYSQKEKFVGISQARKLNFTEILYSCGACSDNNRRMILRDLLHRDNNLCQKRSAQSLAKGEISPVFFKKLQKIVEFEVTIGWLDDKPEIILQLIALEKYIYLLLHLTCHWFNLPNDEKDYGLDLNLPRNPVELFSILQKKKSKLQKSSHEHPIKLFQEISFLKDKYKKSNSAGKKYRRSRMHLLNLQTNLLININIELKSRSVNMFYNYFNIVKKARKRNTQLETSIYLEIILCYNHLFVPNTPPDLSDMIKRVTQRRVTKRDQPQSKKKMKSEEITPIPNTAPNGNLLLPPVASYMSQDISSAESSSAIVNIENASCDTSFGNSSTTILPADIPSVKCDTLIWKEDVDAASSRANSTMNNCIQYPQNIASLDVAPVSIQSKNPGGDESQRLTVGNVNVESKIWMAKSNVDEKYQQPNKNSDWNQRRQSSNDAHEGYRKFCMKINAIAQTKTIDSGLYRRARRVAKEAREFNISYMNKAADDLQRKMINQTLKQIHIDTLQKFIKLENKHRKSVKTMLKHITVN